MGYIKETLLKDERITYITAPHWIVFLPAVLMVVFTIAVYYYAPILFGGNQMLFSINLQTAVTSVLFIFSLYQLAKSIIIHQFTEYGITNRRIVMKTGLIQRNTFETFLDKVEAVNVDQTIMGRILGYGTVVIVGTGGSRDRFFSVPNPLQFRMFVSKQL